MLDIDYSLIPLDTRDREEIQEDIAQKINAGLTPSLDKTRGGRVIVINPDPVQTAHPISDDLRTVLRRITVTTAEGAIVTKAERIFADILASNEPVSALVIEVLGTFAQMDAFLDYIPDLRRRYPDMGVFLHGTTAGIMERLRQLVATKRANLVLSYADARGTVDISDPEEMGLAVKADQDAVTFATPFFSQLRIVVEKNTAPTAVNLDSLRRLHSVFGLGDAKEIDIGGGRRERVVVIDLPMRIIRDVQFRQDRGMEFHGIVQNGRPVLSRHFEREKLEMKWIPLRAMEAFLRRAPGQDHVQRVDLGKAKTMRINCFNGQVAFVMHSAGSQLSLSDPQMVAIRKNYTPTLKMPEGVKPMAGEGNSLIHFDKIVIASEAGGALHPIQKAIRNHFYGRMMMADAIQARKREVYTRRLKVAAVGPLAGQTLKLLRRFGLERLIDPQNFHYLCDTPLQLPTYHLTANRFGEHFQRLRVQLRDIVGTVKGVEMRLADINHKLPISTEWVDLESVGLDQVSPQELDAVYQEMNTVMAFIGHEFQRNFAIVSEDTAFFETIKLCREAGLTAKWLAEYKRGAYGTPLPAGSHPDFLFFGTPQDKAANDLKYFFPSLACSDLFKSTNNRTLFSKVDYEFSVFLEEQLALADHQAREQGIVKPGLEHFAGYFGGKIEETEAAITRLQESMLGIDMKGSAEYQRLLKAEEDAYRSRFDAVKKERVQVAKEHAELEHSFQEFLLHFAKELDLPADPDPDWLASGEPDAAIFDRFFIAAAHRDVQRRRGAVVGQFDQIVAGLRGWMTALRALSDTLDRTVRSHTAWHSAQSHETLNSHAEETAAGIAGRLKNVHGMDAAQRDNQSKRVAVQLTSLDAEIRQAVSKGHQERRDDDRQRKSLVAGCIQNVERLRVLAERYSNSEPHQALALVVDQVKRMGDLARAADQAATGIAASLRASETAFLRQQRLVISRHSLAVDQALLAAAPASQPVLPEIPEEWRGAPPSQPASALELEHKEALAALAKAQAANRTALRPPLLALEAIKLAVQRYAQFREQADELERRSSRKMRMRDADLGLAERQVLMELEMEDLPQRVVEHYLPARKRLLNDVFIPDAQRRRFYFRQAREFLSEALNLATDPLRQLYEERAVQRRFCSRQFTRGLQIASDPAHPRGEMLRNVNTGVNVFFRTLQFNIQKRQPEIAKALKLIHSEPKNVAAILETIKTLHAGGDKQDIYYLILPGTLTLAEALRVINQKDTLYRGVPRLVILFVGKYEEASLARDVALRDAYFKAVKHNVIVNIDGRRLVDNPRAIGLRLLEETLGSSYDAPPVEDIPTEEEHRVVHQAR
jgi:hypothetical protein